MKNYTTDAEMPQGSSAWLEGRKLSIGSSDIGTIIGTNPYKNREELLQEKKGLVVPPDLSNNFHVKRGSELEPRAREMVNLELSSEFHPVVFTHPEHTFCKYSSDGVDFVRNELIEIKCCANKNHSWVLENKKVLPQYEAQLGWAMFVSGIPLCHFVVYNPSHPNPYFRIEVRENKEYQDFLFQEALKFWNEVTGC